MSKRAWSNETAKEYPDPKRAKKEGVNEQDPPPSRVIHCRNVPDGCREGDLVGAVQTFGRVRYVSEDLEGVSCWSVEVHALIPKHSVCNQCSAFHEFVTT